MFDRIFLAHPRSVGESYAQHFGVASRFGMTLIAGGLACFVHALVPAWCKRTGSSTVKRLHDRMSARQPDLRAAWDDPRWRPEYEI